MAKKLFTDRKLIIELSIMLVCKLLLLFLIWHLFFSSAPDDIDHDAVADVIINHSSDGDSP
ncbi:cytochrome oxidase putative small subunit CydP [Methylophaga thalassica]|uniref:cytochrome oxidase putative small subunit CydP n=1 Tax=Methylophaga aminisulfidivorans TaxID=230105 RepID=UPI003D6B00D9